MNTTNYKRPRTLQGETNKTHRQAMARAYRPGQTKEFEISCSQDSVLREMVKTVIDGQNPCPEEIENV